ncbi:putative transposase, partial [Escherichia coli 96.0932]
MVCACSPNV